MNYNDLLIVEHNGTIYGSRINANGEIEYYKQDANGDWLLLDKEVVQC
jgi:hypothetical protein